MQGPPVTFAQMDFETKFLLLRAATALPFTTKAALLAHLAAKFPAIDCPVIEAFFSGLVDFDAIETTFPVQEPEDTESIPVIVEVSNPSSPIKKTGSVSVSDSPDSPHSPHSPHSESESESDSDSPHSEAPSPSSAVSLVVPVKTPSGRTLRSASTVNTNEPRRLRNSSISSTITNTSNRWWR